MRWIWRQTWARVGSNFSFDLAAHFIYFSVLVLTMTDETKNADRSSIEIKDLLRKLHPDRGNHKDRIRKLSKFRNYVMGVSSKKKHPVCISIRRDA